MEMIKLIVEYYEDTDSTEVVFASLHDAVKTDEFVETDEFKIKLSDTKVIPPAQIKSVDKCEHRVIEVHGNQKIEDDPRFIYSAE